MDAGSERDASERICRKGDRNENLSGNAKCNLNLRDPYLTLGSSLRSPDGTAGTVRYLRDPICMVLRTTKFLVCM